MLEPRPKKGLHGRPQGLQIVVIVLFAVVALRLWSLQIVRGEFYRALGERNKTRQVVLKPRRGTLFDRTGRVLATDRMRFDASVDYGDLDDRQRRERVSRLLERVLGVSRAEVEERLDPDKVVSFVPVKIRRGITYEQFAQLKVLEPDTPGLHPEVEYSRHYPEGNAAAHVLGYVAAVSEEAYQAAKHIYDRTSVAGVAGLELSQEEHLRGRKGYLVVEVDNRSRRKKILDDSHPPIPGADVVLTLDLALQKAADRALQGRKGAVVIVDPRNGDVLAMASAPSFDPNLFSVPRSREAVAQIKALGEDQANEPLWNRCISEQYPLGSAFKVVVAVAGLERAAPEKRITPQMTFYCPGSFRLGNRTWRCYHSRAHGEMVLVNAIKKSCNVFFYNVGHRIGHEPIVEVADLFGLGRPTGIDLPSEGSGVNPTREWRHSDDWRAREYRTWYPGYTVNLAIGQYPLEVTPIQVACLYAAIANGGTLFRPRIVRSIEGDDGTVEFEPQGTSVGLKAENIALVRQGCSEVTRTGGTAAGPFSKLTHLKVAGKTSTAQYGQAYEKSYAWFVAFAPYDAPEIVVVVLVEEGEAGGVTAAPLARDILVDYFARRGITAAKGNTR